MRKRSYFLLIKIRHNRWRFIIPVPLFMTSSMIRIAGFLWATFGHGHETVEQGIEVKEALRDARSIIKLLKRFPPFTLVEIQSPSDQITIKTF